MTPPTFIRCPRGVFELRFKRQPILHTPAGIVEHHDFRREEIECYARAGFWQAMEAGAAREVIGAWPVRRPTQAEWDFAINDDGGDGA